MDAGGVIALYAAAVATVALAWNIVRARASDKPNVRVTIVHDPIAKDGGSYTFDVVATNHGKATELVQHVGLAFKGLPPALADLFPAPYVRATIDRTVTPR